MNSIEDFVITLINSALDEQLAPSIPDGVSLSSIYQFAKKHKLESICYSVLKQSGRIDDLQLAEWKRTCMVNLAQSVSQETEKLRISKAFCENNICFLPLKGWIIRGMYPKKEYRFMSDIDILIHREDRAKAMTVMRSLGYSGGGKEIDYDEGYSLPPYLHAELHFDIVRPDYEVWYKYYQKIWEKAIQFKKTEYRLSWNDFYIHMTVNFAKDYFGKGTGIRSVLDFCVFLQKHEQELNWVYVVEELKKLGLDSIEEQVRELAKEWFVNKNATYRSEMSIKLLHDGAYGSYKCFLENYYKKKTNKIRFRLLRKPLYALNRAFPNYAEMCYTYPALNKKPVLLPFYWLKRLIYKRRSISKTWKGLRKIKDEE